MGSSPAFTLVSFSEKKKFSFRVVRHVWHGLQVLEAYFIYWPGIFGPLSLISFRPKGVLLTCTSFLCQTTNFISCIYFDNFSCIRGNMARLISLFPKIPAHLTFIFEAFFLLLFFLQDQIKFCR